MRKIQKCLHQDFSKIIVASDGRRYLVEIKAAAIEAGLGSGLRLVKFLEVSGLPTFLSEFINDLKPVETENLGYSVTTKFVKKSKTGIEERKNRIHEMMAKTKRELEGG